ncbi:MAG: alpha/beta hydrolase [Chitinophagaceae bacterium]|nr:alpha/beta hydrolase [Chitinophagaceae bacterium]
MNRKKLWFIIPLLLLIGYLMGPKPAVPVFRKDMPPVPLDVVMLDDYISKKESTHKIKKDNEARIVWYNDTNRTKTPYAIVYLHGFSASQAEGDPVHRNIAKKFGCNLLLTRLAEHGLDTVDALRKLTADKYWESVKESLAIAKQLGEKVILMGTSTGGTNALQLAAAYPSDVNALVLLSPNIAINDANAWLLNNPWGLQIATMVTGSRYIESKDQRDIYKQYWYSRYRLEGVVALEELLEQTMNHETFVKINQPTLMLYYYKDEVHQDSVVKVAPMLEMFKELKTDPSLKRSKAMPQSGNHVMASFIKSQDLEGVQLEIEKFMTEILHIAPK